MIDKLWYLIPELILFGGVVVVAILGLVHSNRLRGWVPWTTALFVLAAGISAPFVYCDEAMEASGLLVPGLAAPACLIACIVALGLLVLSIGRVDTRYEQAIAQGRAAFDPIRATGGEYHVFFLLSLGGLLLVSIADDLIWLFLALELASLPTYVMVAMSRGSIRAQEAAMKYFFLGAMSAAMFLYGFALLYGATGTLVLTEMQASFADQIARGELSVLAIVGMLLALLGIGFKLAAVPMHIYAADVYEGAAVHVTAFLGFVPKAAGVIAFMILLSTLGWQDGVGLPAPILIMLWVVSVLTMTLGNIAALLQKSVKRMLACSSIAHSGYLLIGIIAGPGAGFNAAMLYLLIYGLGNTASFAVLSSLQRGGVELESVEDLAGLRHKHPWSATAMAISAGSLLGFPPLLGFWGKLALFIAGIASGRLVLVLIAAINSAVSAWYYLRLVGLPLMADRNERSEAVESIHVPWPRLVALVLAGMLVVLPVILGLLYWMTDVSS